MAEKMPSATKSGVIKHAVTREDEQLFAELNLAQAIVGELRKRLVVRGVDVELLNREMLPRIPDAEVTFCEMLDSLGPEFQPESKRFQRSGKFINDVAVAWLVSCCEAFHSGRVAQLRWNARR